MQGTPTPPEAFGDLKWAWFGCASPVGVYETPPVSGFVPGARYDSVEYPIARPGMIWVRSEGPWGAMRLQNRDINRDRPNLSFSGLYKWSERDHDGSECKRHIRITEPKEVTNKRLLKNHGAENVVRQYAFAMLEDGSLAFGVKITVKDQWGSIFAWGSQSAGSIPLLDSVCQRRPISAQIWRRACKCRFGGFPRRRRSVSG